VNLRVDATMVKEQMHIRWVAETGLVDAIEPLVASYKEARGLQVRILYLLVPVYPVIASTLLVWHHEEHLINSYRGFFSERPLRDSTTHSTMTEVIKITICVRFNCDTTTTKNCCVHFLLSSKQACAMSRSRIVVESQL